MGIVDVLVTEMFDALLSGIFSETVLDGLGNTTGSSRGGVILFNGGAFVSAFPPKLGLALCSAPDPVDVGLLVRGKPADLPVFNGLASPTNMDGDFPCLSAVFVTSSRLSDDEPLSLTDMDENVGLALVSAPAVLPVLVSCFGTVNADALLALLSVLVLEAVVPEIFSLMGEDGGLINELGLLGDVGGAVIFKRPVRFRSR